MTKQVKLALVGDTKEDTTRTQLVLRAWMIWRARSNAVWLDQHMSRQRLFVEEAERLYDYVRRLQPQSDGLLGNSASMMLYEWVPDLVGKLLKS